MQKIEDSGIDRFPSMPINYAASLPLYQLMLGVWSSSLTGVHGSMQLSKNYQVQLIFGEFKAVYPRVCNLLFCELRQAGVSTATPLGNKVSHKPSLTVVAALLSVAAHLAHQECSRIMEVTVSVYSCVLSWTLRVIFTGVQY